jgi:hypothetical protein
LPYTATAESDIKLLAFPNPNPNTFIEHLSNPNPNPDPYHHIGITISPYTATAESDIELLALHKTDYDLFMKEIKSSERRELFMILRDNFLFENWTRLKLEKLTNLCNKRIFEQG